MSQTSEWKMSFVILASAARRLADMALWLQSPFEMELEGMGVGVGGLGGFFHSSVAFELSSSAAKGRRPRQLENDAYVSPPGVLLYPLSSFCPAITCPHHPPVPSGRTGEANCLCVATETSQAASLFSRGQGRV